MISLTGDYLQPVFCNNYIGADFLSHVAQQVAPSNFCGFHAVA
jgi:hypothetical protein